MITTRVEHVYEVFLPAEVRTVLQRLRVVISLGIEGVPLACVGFDGYLARLRFWMSVPLILIALSTGGVLIKLIVRRCTGTRPDQKARRRSSGTAAAAAMKRPRLASLGQLLQDTIEHVTPIVLRIFFLMCAAP